MLHNSSLTTRSRTLQSAAWLFLGSFAIVALTLFAYRDLPARPFAADDFQWLIGARTLDFGTMLQHAFDPGQEHFYRPMVWIMFWLQARAFELDPRGYHAISLGLHVANALLLGGLIWRVVRTKVRGLRTEVRVVRTEETLLSPQSSVLIAFLPAAFVALHPAAFEAVTWVSAQSELLAAFWLLLALHLWLIRRPTTDGGRGSAFSSIVHRLPSTVCLALALLTKESAVIGLPLLVLLDLATANQSRITHHASRVARFVLPTLLTLAYLALQLRVERENYVVGQGGYGLGWQLIANPLRSLALVVAPLPGIEHANAPWLVPVGAVVGMLLLAWLVADCRLQIEKANLQSAICNLQSAIPLAALALTLLPTAPFVSPPDSRYLYLPVMAFACVGVTLAGWLGKRWKFFHSPVHRPSSTVHMLALAAITVVLSAYAIVETSSREQRFATATGADGSLMHVAIAACAARTPDRVILLNAPMAEQHARALLELACGDTITPIFVDSMEIAEANLEANSLIIDFPNGAAHVAQQT